MAITGTAVSGNPCWLPSFTPEGCSLVSAERKTTIYEVTVKSRTAKRRNLNFMKSMTYFS